MGYWGSPITIESVATDPIDTDRSTSETIGKMIVLARSSSQSPLIASIVDTCLSSSRNKTSQRDLARSIYWWVKNHIRFVEDETVLGSQLGYQDVNQELLISPEVLVTMPIPMGDCDDFSMLIAALLCCAHIRCMFVTIAADEVLPWKFSHVFPVALLDSGYMTMDASHGNSPGWEYGKQFRRMEWLIN